MRFENFSLEFLSTAIHRAYLSANEFGFTDEQIRSTLYVAAQMRGCAAAAARAEFPGRDLQILSRHVESRIRRVATESLYRSAN